MVPDVVLVSAAVKGRSGAMSAANVVVLVRAAVTT